MSGATESVKDTTMNTIIDFLNEGKCPIVTLNPCDNGTIIEYKVRSIQEGACSDANAIPIGNDLQALADILIAALASSFVIGVDSIIFQLVLKDGNIISITNIQHNTELPDYNCPDRFVVYTLAGDLYDAAKAERQRRNAADKAADAKALVDKAAAEKAAADAKALAEKVAAQQDDNFKNLLAVLL